MRQGFQADQIAIVSLRGQSSAVYRNMSRIAGKGIRRFTGRYDDDGSPIHTAAPLHAETIYRFKGQQAPAVILTDIELSVEPDHRERETALLWCGLIRATVACALLVHQECGWLNAMQRARK